jgi:hypothetical protein
MEFFNEGHILSCFSTRKGAGMVRSLSFALARTLGKTSLATGIPVTGSCSKDNLVRDLHRQVFSQIIN